MSQTKITRRAFICSPFRAATKDEQHRNITYARELAREAIADGAAPYVPHLYLPQILDDGKAVERRKGIRAGLKFLEACDEIWVGARYGITAGMKEEIAYAKAHGIRVRTFEA